MLLLTRESERELADLAGNAMTSTVVGAAMLSAFVVSHEIMTRPKVSETIRTANLGLGLGFKKMREDQLDNRKLLNFDGSNDLSLEGLSELAKKSVRLCYCEGQGLTALSPMRKCKRCDYYCCEKCGNMPKHDYELFGGNGVPLRTGPQEFRARVGYAIPTRLQIDGFSPKLLEDLAQRHPDRSDEDWTLFCDAVLLASKEQYRYESVKRSHCWTVVYNAIQSRLELVFDQDEVYWLLFGKASSSEPGNSRVRQLLDQPLARLTVRGESMRGDLIEEEDILQGSWEIRIPVTQILTITVTPQGSLTDSWEKRLGLQDDKFLDKQVYTSLSIACTSTSPEETRLVHEICGDYDLLDHCGTACSGLHKKRSTPGTVEPRPLFLFLDVDRIGRPDDDSYVFARTKQRLEYGESRYVVAKVDNKWRPPYTNSATIADRAVPSQADCTVSSRWESYPIFLRPHKGSADACSRFPKRELSMPVFGENQNPPPSSASDNYGCMHEIATTALLSCELPGQLADTVGWQVGHWTIIDQKSERYVAAAFAWLFARVKTLGELEGSWRCLGTRPSEYQRCQVCAPEPPKIMWTCSRNHSKKEKIIPYEDGREAGDFERRVKARPAPFLVQTHIDDDEKRTGRLMVGLNLPTLVHRALARLGDITDSDDVEMKWRLDTQFEAPTRYKLKDFELTNNKLHLEADCTFPTDEKLRPEQKRSLQWMIGQEADDMSFYEEEIEEATLSQLGWRAEVRVRRTRILRGGILADEVGYGKTATTLALIHTQRHNAEQHAAIENAGCISVKATLVLVPPHLVHQWKGQTHKFLGTESADLKILVIENVGQLARTTISQIKEALVVIVSWKVLSSPAYMTHLSHFATLPPGPSSGEREIEAWLTRACDNVKKHVGELVDEYESPKGFAAVLKERLKAAHTDKDILRDIPTQRLKGAKYATFNPADYVEPSDRSPNAADLEKFFKNMTNCDSNSDSMPGILLHMFNFYRLVVDEYTYVDEEKQVEKLSSFITTIDARSRWVLSGTPNLEDFGDVRNLASFLAYNLGVVDDAAGVVRGATIRRIRDYRTGRLLPSALHSDY